MKVIKLSEKTMFKRYLMLLILAILIMSCGNTRDKILEDKELPSRLVRAYFKWSLLTGENELQNLSENNLVILDAKEFITNNKTYKDSGINFWFIESSYVENGNTLVVGFLYDYKSKSAIFLPKLNSHGEFLTANEDHEEDIEEIIQYFVNSEKYIEEEYPTTETYNPEDTDQESTSGNGCLDFSEEWYYDDETANYQNERFEYSLFFPKQLAVVGVFEDKGGAIITGENNSKGTEWWNAEVVVFAQPSGGKTLNDLYQSWSKEQKLEGFYKDEDSGKIMSYYYNLELTNTIIEKKQQYFIIEGNAFDVGATDYSLFYQKVIYDKTQDVFYFIRMLHNGFNQDGYIYKKMIDDCIPNFRNHVYVP